MPQVNPTLLFKVLNFQVDLRKLENRTKRLVLEELTSMQENLTAELGRKNLSELNKKELRERIATIKPIIAEHNAVAAQILEDDLSGLAKMQVKQVKSSLKSTVFIGQDVTMPSPQVIDRVSRNVLIDGGIMSDWWKKQSANDIFKVTNAVRQGVLYGRSNEDTISIIVSELEISRKNAAALVQTSMAQVSNDARQTVYDENTDIIKNLVWVAAFDSRTCKICIPREGLKWKNNDDKTPLGHSIPFEVAPLHFNCRCLMVPETLTFEEMGVDLKEPEMGDRASSLGPIKADSSFDDYLKQVPDDQVDKMLGKGRAKLWRDKKITLNQLIDARGEELTLNEIVARHVN